MRPKYAPITVLALLFVLPSIILEAGASTADDTVLSKLSPSLLDAGLKVVDGSLISCNRAESVDVLIHVEEASPGDLRDRLEMLGVNVGYRFSAVDIYEASCPMGLINRLTGVDEVISVEWDAPVIHDMDISSGVVNAPEVWASRVYDTVLKKEGITGEGATIVVVDSGIDAGHPDLDMGQKTLVNIKAPSAGSPWVDMENTDTSVGHGSHCAGISAGNGDASAGARRGVAPGASLIGLSLMEGDESTSTANYLYGLEWVYEHSRPGSSYGFPPIRVCTNSWHTTVGEYDPDSALSKIINKLAYENNVVCTFSAGNDGRNDPEGTEIWTSQQGATPCAVMVAAYARDGSYVADFTSHGMAGLNHTYPDVGAPGVRIWAAHARRTVISAGSKAGGNPNPYYLAISGTSMSTPHVAGAVALLWEACPSMGISPIREDYNGSDNEWFLGHPYSFVHDAEIIIEASATPIQYVPGREEELGIFREDPSTGWWGRPIDYAQGYGLIDVGRAVGIALTLQKLRERYDEEATPFDAIMVYNVIMDENVTGEGDVLVSFWKGEYSRYNDQNNKPLVVQNQTKLVYIPEGAEGIELTLDYQPFSASAMYAGGLTVEVDVDLDGDPDYSGGIPAISAPGTYAIPVSGTDTYYGFTVKGQGFKFLRPLRDRSYVELRIDYSIYIEITLGEGEVSVGNRTYSMAKYSQPYLEGSAPAGEGNVTLGVRVYRLENVRPPPEEKPSPGKEEGTDYLLLLVLILVVGAAITTIYLYRRRKGPEGPG